VYLSFLTIPYSHYVEYARWSLKLGKKKFIERAYMPGQHVLPLLSLRVGGSNKHLSDSSFVTSATGPEWNKQKDSSANRKRSTAVPALVLPNDKVLVDSWSIASYSGLPHINNEQKQLYDSELGPLARQFAYGIFLHPDNRDIWDMVLTKDQGILWRICYYFFANYLWKLLRKIFAVGNIEQEILCEEKLMKLFHFIEEKRLQNIDMNTKIVKSDEQENEKEVLQHYINGKTMTLEDVALCSLCGPILFPQNYCDGVFNEAIMKFEAKKDNEGMKKIQLFRETKLGKYVSKFYEIHRKF
jgi:hypothetical protein